MKTNKEMKNGFAKGWKGFLLLVAVSATGGYFVGRALARSGLDLEAPAFFNGSMLAALVVAAPYVLVGAGLLFALVIPSIGAKTLTGVDAQDLRDERAMYLSQSLVALLFGFALIVMALAGPQGPIAPVPAAISFVVTMALGLIIYIRSWSHLDELMRAATLESAAWTYGLLLLAGGGWSAMAHLDVVPGLAALDWLSLFWGLSLVASIIAAGRRGMLVEGPD